MWLTRYEQALAKSFEADGFKTEIRALGDFRDDYGLPADEDEGEGGEESEEEEGSYESGDESGSGSGCGSECGHGHGH